MAEGLMNGDFWMTLKGVGDVVVPWVIVPGVYLCWHILDQMKSMRAEQRADRKDTTEKFHAMELRQARLEAEQEHSQRQREGNHTEILRRLDEITGALKGKADK